MNKTSASSTYTNLVERQSWISACIEVWSSMIKASIGMIRPTIRLIIFPTIAISAWWLAIGGLRIPASRALWRWLPVIFLGYLGFLGFLFFLCMFQTFRKHIRKMFSCLPMPRPGPSIYLPADSIFGASFFGISFFGATFLALSSFLTTGFFAAVAAP